MAYPDVKITPQNWNGYVTARAIKVREDLKSLIPFDGRKHFVDFISETHSYFKTETAKNQLIRF